MNLLTKACSVGAAVVLSVGVMGMAHAAPHSTMRADAAPGSGDTSAMAGMSHEAIDPRGSPAGRITQRSAERIWSRGGLPRLLGSVDRLRNLTISKNPVASGRYRLVIKDTTAHHNWHIFGSGVDFKTGIRATGTWGWRVHLRDGTYKVVCDRHASIMRLGLKVT